MFGPFGWAARELGNDRSDYGGRWLDRGRISPEQTLAGMKWVGPLSAGDVVIMPESTTHAALPWQPLDRARRIQVFRFIPQTWAGYANPPVRIWPALFCTCTDRGRTRQPCRVCGAAGDSYSPRPARSRNAGADRDRSWPAQKVDCGRRGAAGVAAAERARLQVVNHAWGHGYHTRP